MGDFLDHFRLRDRVRLVESSEHAARKLLLDGVAFVAKNGAALCPSDVAIDGTVA
jgi:hypothetical protein